ncbi:tetraspanin 29Fb [Arctopsyche grandis]|uniref:tetraspanin 29Fb n=1 Tax=Arctopsyche grandis TaxID=121162 RepID=UPI00406D77CA
MADLNLGMKCIKYMLLTVNAMFLLTATLIIMIGVTIHSLYGNFTYFIEAAYFSPASLLIAIGIIMLIVSLFGCFGAAKESTCLINIFSLLLSLVFIMEISAAIAAYSLPSGLNEMISGNLNDSMQLYGENTMATKELDVLQSKWICCGVNDYKEWENTPYGNKLGDDFVPKSCCGHSEHGESCDITDVAKSGCLRQMKDIISNSAILLGTGSLTVAFIQFIGIVFSIMLAKAIRQAKTERERRRWEIREQMANAYSQMERHHGKTLDNTTPVIYVPSIGQTQA